MIRENPYFFENSTYNPDTNSYHPDTKKVWVCGIYKKTLLSLGVKIIKSVLGGHIGHYATTKWCFLIPIEDKQKIKEWSE